MIERVTAERDNLRQTLLLAALPHVPFEGWGRKALLAGARDVGIATPLALDAFPAGAKEMIECFCRGRRHLGDRRDDERGDSGTVEVQPVMH